MQQLDIKKQAAIFVQQGLLQHKKGNFLEAEKQYSRALELDSKQSDACHLLGMLKHEQGDVSCAVELLTTAIDINPDVAVYHNNLGNIYSNIAKLSLAEKYFNRALTLDNHYQEAIFNLSCIKQKQGKSQEAKVLLRELLLIDSGFVPALHNLLQIYLLEDDVLAAYSHVKENVQNPEYKDLSELFLHVMIQCYGKIDDLPEKIELQKNILLLDEENLEIRFNLANSLKDSGAYGEAEKHYEKILKIDKHYFGALVNYGVIDLWKGRFDAALTKFEVARQIKPDDYILLNNLGMVHQALQKVDQSIKCYQQAIAVDENRPEAYWNYSLLLLMIGEYKKGWRYYEYRWRIKDQLLNDRREYDQPQWRGEPLGNKKLFVYCEQGYGDAIQFVRFVIELLKKDRKVAVECPKSLSRLFKKIGRNIEVVQSDEDFYDFDYHIAMMSLPYILNNELSSIPAHVPYLTTSLSDQQEWQTRLSENRLLKVGIVWAGNPREHSQVNNLIDQRRSCQLTDFSDLLKVEGVQFYSLQKHESVIATNSAEFDNVIDLMAEVNDFYDTACFVQNLDLIISVDTAVAHLAAALGRPVWLLSRYDGCWRWLLNRDDSPWYPGLKIYRQQVPGDWQEVFKQIRFDLEQCLSKS